jgi:Raf kinase inhibitor-like YbhB/YbcL family protein
VDDPDAPAGTWVHWVLYNLPANTSELPEGMDKREELATGALQGRNDFRKIGYGGPRPPRGKPHHYYFKLYALDIKLDLKPEPETGPRRAMKGHIWARSLWGAMAVSCDVPNWAPAHARERHVLPGWFMNWHSFAEAAALRSFMECRELWETWIPNRT